jgi:hypothetical protein
VDKKKKHKVRNRGLDIAVTKNETNPPSPQIKEGVLKTTQRRWKRRGKPLAHKPQDYIRDY